MINFTGQVVNKDPKKCVVKKPTEPHPRDITLFDFNIEFPVNGQN